MKASRWFRRVVVCVFAAVCAAGAAGAADKYWTGAVDANANKPGNWCDGLELSVVSTALPADGDVVHLTCGSNAMTWNVDGITLGGWVQDGYTGTVTFMTGRQNGTSSVVNGFDVDGTKILKITGDCTVNSGTWTHATQPSLGSSTAAWTTGEGVYRLIAEVGGNMTLGDGAKIDVIACGFLNGQGPGKPGVQAAASHGGWGGYWLETSPVPCYGSFRHPVTIGSGANAGAGFSGGGSVQLTVAGTLTLSATSQILANAKPLANYYPPSGGSIWITAGRIVGGGVISADGSTTTGSYNSGYGGGGGGGRVAIYLTGDGEDFPAGFKSIPTAQSGRYYDNNQNNAFGGTIYYETKADVPGEGELWADKGTSSHADRGADILPVDGTAIHLRKVVFREGGTLQVQAGIETFSVDEIESLRESGTAVGKIRSHGATLVFGANAQSVAAVNVWLRKSAALKIGDAGDGTLEIGNLSTLTVDAQSSLTGSLHVASGGTVTHTRAGSAEAGSLRLKVTGDMTVDAGGLVTALGLGYEPKKGPGSSADGAFAGMHGGRAWNASATRHCYGSITRPTMYGSGGGDASTSSKPYGGGAIALEVLGDFVNNGTVTADGSSCTYYSGAGGSVWIRAKTLSGAGVFSANGGTHTHSGGTNEKQGSGGRVAVWLTGEGADFSAFENLSATFQAFGGVKNGTIYGAPGTVYLQTGAQQEHEGTLIIDNNGRNTYETEICAGGIGEVDVTDAEVGDVIIRNGGKLRIDTATLTVHGDLTNATTLTGVNGGLAFVDANRVSHITGANTCSQFRCETPGKRLIFGTGANDLLTVSDNGAFTVVGDSEHPVVLRGDDASAHWKLAVSSTAEVRVEFVDPAKSDASAGQKVVANNSDVGKEQDNVNWGFVTVVPGMEITWTGEANDLWSDADNWDLGRSPVETDRVIVPALTGDGVRYPRLGGFSVRVLSLAVAAGASLRLDGGELAVDEATSVAGSLVANGGERVALYGDVTFAKGAFVPARSTVCLTGDAAQQVDFAGARLFNLSCEKAGGGVNFTGPFAVDGQLTMAADGAWTARFGAVGEYACERLVANGAVGGVAALTLTGAAVWRLNVRTYADVRGVTAKNSKAVGQKIYPQAPAVDGTGNEGWVFGVVVKTWTGGDGDFASEDHWAGGVPGAGDVAAIDSAATVTVSEPAEVGLLTVSGTSAKLVVLAPLAVVENLTVADGGSIAMDSPVTVGGSVSVLADGTLTHSANGATEQYKLDLTVGGGMFVDANGKVDVLGMGYGVGQGPGSNGSNNQCGGSYGGNGFRIDKGTQTKSYGSVFHPFELGSGGGYNQKGTERGGGAAKITVEGTLTVNGVITADGAGATYYTGSGGSIWLTCGELAGAGRIRADGGQPADSYPGSGGRIAIYQRVARGWTAWDGIVTAYGGRDYSPTGSTRPRCGAGTIYLQCAGDAELGGEVIIDNDNGAVSVGTSVLPDVQPGDRLRDFRFARFVMQNNGQLNVTTNLTVGDVSLDTVNSHLKLNGNTLTIRSQVHKDRAGWKGSVTEGGGDIVWRKNGMVLMLR